MFAPHSRPARVPTWRLPSPLGAECAWPNVRCDRPLLQATWTWASWSSWRGSPAASAPRAASEAAEEARWDMASASCACVQMCVLSGRGQGVDEGSTCLPPSCHGKQQDLQRCVTYVLCCWATRKKGRTCIPSPCLFRCTPRVPLRAQGLGAAAGADGGAGRRPWRPCARLRGPCRCGRYLGAWVPRPWMCAGGWAPVDCPPVGFVCLHLGAVLQLGRPQLQADARQQGTFRPGSKDYNC